MQADHKKAFTMIELIFVIVIIGILAAIAIPKLAGTATEAQKNNVSAFMGTLNRTVGPALWATHFDNDGSVKTVSDSEFLDAFTAVPQGVVNIDLSQCADGNESVGEKIADITTVAVPQAEELFCIDGKISGPPKFAFSSDMNRSLQHN